jgi:uncharacterized protein
MQDLSSKDAQNGAMFCHLGSLIGSLVTSITFGGAVGALLFWLIGREKSAFIDAHGRESLNFQLSMLIYAVATVMLCFVGVGLLLLPVLFVIGILFPILATAAASRGEHYRYPLTIRFF